MEFITVIVLLILTVILIKTIYNINIKEIKEIGEKNKELDDEVSKYPPNIEICNEILKRLNNKKVKIEEDNNAKNCLYIAVSNKIVIANMRNSFTRIQTISHECLHSVQDRKIQLFNFIYSNIYLLYFVIVSIMIILNVIKNNMFFLAIYIIMGYIYYFIRSYLENDAMIKARYLAKEYIEEQNISSKDKIEKIIMEYDKLNNIGIKTVNYVIFLSTVNKTILLCVIIILRLIINQF